MDVTRANFEVVLPKFSALLEEAEFASFDLEMTGIRMAGHEGSILDPAHVAFIEKNMAAAKYNIIQLGVCLFVRKSADGADVVKYDAYPFNFFAFPGNKDGDVCMNVDTAAFLTKHGMDFSKWITTGIPYLPHTLAGPRRAAMEEEGGSPGLRKRPAWDQAKLAQVDRTDMSNFTDAMAQAQRYADAAAASAASPPDSPLPMPATLKFPFFKQRETVPLFEQYLASLALMKRCEKGPKGNMYYVVPASEAESHATRALEEQIGLTRLYDMLVARRIPLVAHNSLSDHLFLHYAFDGRPIEDLQRFKQFTRSKFPCLYDTRLLATLPSLPYDPKTVQNLEGQWKSFREQYGTSVVCNLPLGFEAYDPAVLQHDSRAHEAAYDALITGDLLLLAARALGDGSIGSLSEYANCLPVYRCLETVQINKDADAVLHDGPVIAFHFPGGSGMSSTRIDGILSGTELRGRVLWNHDCAFVFCPKRARGDLLNKNVDKARKKFTEICRKGKIEIITA